MEALELLMLSRKHSFIKTLITLNLKENLAEESEMTVRTKGMYVLCFPNRKGLNFFRWLWACTDILQPIYVGTDLNPTIKKLPRDGGILYLSAGTYDMPTLSRDNLSIYGSIHGKTLIKQPNSQSQGKSD